MNWGVSWPLFGQINQDLFLGDVKPRLFLFRHWHREACPSSSIAPLGQPHPQCHLGNWYCWMEGNIIAHSFITRETKSSRFTQNSDNLAMQVSCPRDFQDSWQTGVVGQFICNLCHLLIKVKFQTSWRSCYFQGSVFLLPPFTFCCFLFGKQWTVFSFKDIGLIHEFRLSAACRSAFQWHIWEVPMEWKKLGLQQVMLHVSLAGLSDAKWARRAYFCMFGRVFLEESSRWIGELIRSRRASPVWVGSTNLLRTWIEQKFRKG